MMENKCVPLFPQVEYEELQATLQSLDGQLATLKAETQTANLNELADTNQSISQLRQELIKAQQRNQQQVITSPIKGSVQQLATHTVGGVVTPAQELMLIVRKRRNWKWKRKYSTRTLALLKKVKLPR